MSCRKTKSFCKEKRFQNYAIQAKKTTSRVGPGSYSPICGIGVKKIPGGHIYKDLLGKKFLDDEGYFYVNNNLVFDSRLSKRSKHNLNEDSDLDMPSSALNSFSVNQRSNKNFKIDGSKKLLIGSKSQIKRMHTKSDFFGNDAKKKKEIRSARNLSHLLDERFKY
jgi:hypothetical protein